jgi:hypothetical protein
MEMKMMAITNYVKVGILAAIACVALTTQAAAVLTIYEDDQAGFEALNFGLPVESFVEAVTIETSSFVGPLDSTTSNDVFSPGDILTGILFEHQDGSGGNWSVGTDNASGSHILNPGNAVGANIHFSGSPTAVGLHLNMYTGRTFMLTVYIDDVAQTPIATSTTGSGVHLWWWGVTTGTGAITRLDVVNLAAGQNSGIANVQFGGTESVAPSVPAVSLAGRILLGFLLLTVLSVARSSTRLRARTSSGKYAPFTTRSRRTRIELGSGHRLSAASSR